jgi:hypothetical protein
MASSLQNVLIFGGSLDEKRKHLFLRDDEVYG